MRAGLIGIGNMGKALATRLRGQGVEILVWNRTFAKARDLDAIMTDTPAALASRTETIFLNLTDSRAVSDVLSRKDGLLSANLSGKLIIDATTNHPEEVLRFHSVFSDRGARYLEAALSGSVVPAITGTLTVYCSGAEDAYRDALPYLEKAASYIFYLGGPGMASRFNLIENLVLGAVMASLAEAVALAEKAGLDRATAVEIFSRGAVRSALMDAKKERLLKGDFAPQFKSSLMYKDLCYLQELLKSMKTASFTAAVVKELYGLALSRGYGDEDFSAVYKTLKGL